MCLQVFLISFWDLAILCLSDLIRETQSLASYIARDCDLDARFYKIRCSATDFFVRLASLITQDSLDAVPLEGSEFTLPILAHHANTKVIVLAVQKSIENHIDIKLTEIERATGDFTASDPVTLRHELHTTLKPMLWCLMSLQATVSGRLLTQRALDGLMKRWGSIIMECWTLNEWD